MRETGSQTSYFGIANLPVSAHPHSLVPEKIQGYLKNKYNIKENKTKIRGEDQTAVTLYAAMNYYCYNYSVRAYFNSNKTLVGILWTWKVAFYQSDDQRINNS